MGIDAGFDMVPRLTTGAVDRQNWKSFIQIISDRYQNDDQVEAKPNYLEFKAGEHPLLPYEGHKFLRFSSKTSLKHPKGIHGYIDTVSLAAKLYFSSRVRCWNQAFDEFGYYSWQDVHDSLRSYEQPDEPVIPTTIAQFVLGTDPIKELGLPVFDVQSVPGKGKGVVARFNIAKGTRILCEKPFFTAGNLSPPSFMEENIAKKLKMLSKNEQRQFLLLHNNFPGKYPFGGIVKTNALPCGAGSVTGGVYPTICRINHSCLPNAHHSWNSEKRCETIHATRYIKCGEEITIAYDSGGPSECRHNHLKDAFGFVCSCSVCSLPPAELQTSNVRRTQIQILDRAIGDPSRVMSRPGDCLADCYRLLQLLKEEYNDTSVLVARLYYDAFQIGITHGDQARASVFAERAYRARVTCEGEDSPETQKMKEFMENPSGHRNYEASRKWKTSKKMTPKGLTIAEFEKWLWRQGR